MITAAAANTAANSIDGPPLKTSERPRSSAPGRNADPLGSTGDELLCVNHGYVGLLGDVGCVDHHGKRSVLIGSHSSECLIAGELTRVTPDRAAGQLVAEDPEARVFYSQSGWATFTRYRLLHLLERRLAELGGRRDR